MILPRYGLSLVPYQAKFAWSMWRVGGLGRGVRPRPAAARICSADETDEGGRGPYLVDQIAIRWGSRPLRDGKAVGFEIPIDGQPGSRGRADG
jgi:hypothetical protein